MKICRGGDAMSLRFGLQFKLQYAGARRLHLHQQSQPGFGFYRDDPPCINGIADAHLGGMAPPTTIAGSTDQPVDDTPDYPETVEIVIALMTADRGDLAPQFGR